MSKLDYNSLASKVRSIDPYRGTMRYPMDNRSNRQNIFELVETENDVEFHVSHGYSYQEVPISEARFKLLDGVRGAKVYKKDRDYQKFDFYTHTITPRVLCVVRSDNSLEYVNSSYYQGDNMKMSDWSHGYQYDSYKMSGTAWSGGYHMGNSKNHPIFKGLRIDQETREPINQNIQVFRRTVNRKKSKELMCAYKDAFKSPDALLRCMDVETMLVSAKDILDEHEPKVNEGSSRSYIATSEYFKLAEQALADKANFDAVVLYAMSLQLDGFNHWAMDNWKAGQTRSYHRMIEPKNVVSRVVTNLSKRIYKEHKPFDEEEVEFNKCKGSEWGLRVVVNGVDINR
jgi:hypothetical protein